MVSEARKLIASTAESMVGWGYLYGATGWICTEARVAQQAAQYPTYADLIRKYGLGKWLGKHCVDCAQLTKLCAKAAGITLPSGATSQWNADVWAEKGTIDSLPEESEGLFLYRQSGGKMQHTGVCMGDGTDIEARGHAYGVIRREMATYGWTHWARAAEPGESTKIVGDSTNDTQGGISVNTLAGYICTVSNLKTGTTKLNVRAAADTDAAKVTTVSSGEQVTCISDTGTWAYIKTAGGQTGYCMSKYLTAVSEVADDGSEDDSGDEVTLTLTAAEVSALKTIFAKL